MQLINLKDGKAADYPDLASIDYEFLGDCTRI
jgi:hypothetical protein